jgi:hypothetical protein
MMVFSARVGIRAAVAGLGRAQPGGGSRPLADAVVIAVLLSCPVRILQVLLLAGAAFMIACVPAG